MEDREKRRYGYDTRKSESGQPQDRSRRKLNKKHLGIITQIFTRPRIWFIIKYGTIFAAIFLAALTLWSVKDLPDINALGDRNIHQSTKIYDRTGTHLLHEFYTDQKRTIVEFNQLPKNLINGVIATEDKSFYTHHGVRPLSIARAIIYGLLPGHKVAGTSTLTQQLVKNAILTNERTWFRKAREIILSLLLETKYKKDDILKIYFNEIGYGASNYGVESAAQSYFGKHVSDLTLAESATLAGMPQQPTTFLNHQDRLLERRNFVLRRMNEEGYISEAEKIAAQKEPLNLKRNYVDSTFAPHFVLQYVKESLVDQFGEQMVDTGGLKVITTLDYDKQVAAQAAISQYSKLLLDAGSNNAALVAMDPKTSQILAMVGSKDFNDEKIDGQFNVAVDARRQPGSSIKPIIYAAAMEKGYTPDTILFDVNTNFAVSGKPYIPLNYDLGERGPVTMRQALQGSLNIPAVQTFYLVGQKKGIEFAKRMGYSTFGEGDFGLSLVLGGGAVSMLEHVNAYGIFANNGYTNAPVGILKVTDTKNNTLYEWKQDQKQVLDPSITSIMSNILSDDAARAYVFGAGSALTLPGRPVAAKTGTTNEYKDAWTVGYTPSLVAGVWSGNSDNTKMKAGYGGSKIAGQIWNAFMVGALKGSPVENFPPLPTNTAEKAILRGSSGGGITVAIDKVTGKLATSSTPEKYIEEKTFIQPHSILYYVDKDDPRGPIPPDPNVDPQYSIWEAAIQDWINRRKEKDPTWNMSFEDAPTEYDDQHSLELIPILEVAYPTASSTLTSRRIDTDIRVSATRGVSKVTYKIDEKFVAVVREHPFNLNYVMRGLSNGPHTLDITVEDDVGNLINQNIPFILEADEEKPGAFFSAQDQSMSQNSFPRTFLLSPLALSKIAGIQVFAQRTGDSQKTLLADITDFTSLIDGQIPLVWNDKPSVGNWTLSAVISLRAGETYTSDSVNIQITN